MFVLAGDVVHELIASHFNAASGWLRLPAHGRESLSFGKLALEGCHGQDITIRGDGFLSPFLSSGNLRLLRDYNWLAISTTKVVTGDG